MSFLKSGAKVLLFFVVHKFFFMLYNMFWVKKHFFCAICYEKDRFLGFVQLNYFQIVYLSPINSES